MATYCSRDAGAVTILWPPRSQSGRQGYGFTSLDERHSCIGEGQTTHMPKAVCQPCRLLICVDLDCKYLCCSSPIFPVVRGAFQGQCFLQGDRRVLGWRGRAGGGGEDGHVLLTRRRCGC